MPNHTLIAALCASAALLAACGGGSTGPASVGGTWLYSAQSLTGSGLTCSISSLTMDMQQSGTTVSGTTTGGNLVCQDQQGNQATGTFNSTDITGQLTSNNSITLQFGGTSFESTGTVNAHTITGTSTVDLTFNTNGGGQTAVTLTGNFTAAKQ